MVIKADGTERNEHRWPGGAGGGRTLPGMPWFPGTQKSSAMSPSAVMPVTRIPFMQQNYAMNFFDASDLLRIT
ncbi:hypothetical protein [Paenarthrobacter sp. NPDC090522]|uniref:hypothetical protein n=1 Tax=Paenarthrobacter sp. NPDC090522 TaxID=3364383 RepID=UPI0038092A4F